MMTGPTYLALLSTGKISSDDVIDTEFGIYKDVKDHNWCRGGYGQLTLEQALGYRSQVAFTKAKERVYGNQTVLLDNKISEYLADIPNNAMGLLTFYNAVANGGRMVKLQAEGDDVIVLNEQIAEPTHITTLQKGMEHAVKRGLFRKAGRSYTSVAACGRTFYKPAHGVVRLFPCRQSDVHHYGHFGEIWSSSQCRFYVWHHHGKHH